jgi:caa(3)-type oxidase subunit IV
MADHTHTEGHEEHTGHGGHHVFDAATLKKTFFILVGLTILTVVLALWERGYANVFGLEFEFPALPLGVLSVPVALAIAGTKVYWVASRFMGLKFEKTKTNALVFLGSSSFLLVFFGFTWLDFAFRDTFEELSAVPTDVLEEEVLQAQEVQTEIADEFDAVPLVRETPDADLFRVPETDAAGSQALDAAVTTPAEAATE